MSSTPDASSVWLVTGSSRGLGRKIVEAALERGDCVVATARHPESLADLTAKYATTLRTTTHDVKVRAHADAAVALAHDAFGGLDVLVNNAGYANLEAIEDASEDSFRDQIETDYFGTVHTTRAALPALRQRAADDRTPHIINVSSLGGRLASPGLGAYQSAKWAIGGFTEVLAQEIAPLGIKVTAIEPGGMDTDWAGSSMTIPTVSAPYQATVGAVATQLGAMRPLGDTDKVAQVVLQLADMDEPPLRLLLGSEAYAYATGYAQNLHASDAQWLPLTRSTDRDDATDTDRDPLGALASNPESIVRRFIDEVINGGNHNVLGEIWSDDLEWHGGSLGDIHGLAAYKAFAAANGAGAFSGMHLDVKEIITAGNKVVVRFTNSGTQVGEFMGTPASGKHAEWLGIGIYTVQNGKITEGWFGEDILGMLLQLGIRTLPG
ncbi:SDR family NAD(P)-dependent oxidoreductase [Amycolatopsis sp. NPDC003731]